MSTRAQLVRYKAVKLNYFIFSPEDAIYVGDAFHKITTYIKYNKINHLYTGDDMKLIERETQKILTKVKVKSKKLRNIYRN